MQIVKATQIKKYVGKEIKMQGWVRNYRKASSKLRFIVFRDGTSEVQLIAFRPDLSVDSWDLVKSLTIETSVEVVGVAKPHPKRESEFEFHLTDLKIVGNSPDYPISKKEHGADFLLSNRHLWLRSKRQVALQKIRHTIYFGICSFLNEQDFVRFDSPIITPNCCEGTTTLFEVPYFDLGNGYLSQSGQLYLEAGAAALGRVYDFGPVFRAEKSKTRKHLTEFWMADAEASFVNHKQSMKLQEDLIRYLIKLALDKNFDELALLERDVEKLKKADASFFILTYGKAIEKLQKLGFEIDYGSDFGAEHEKAITADSNVPIFIEKWPKQIKSFYMKLDQENPNLALGSDLIAPEGFGEIIGGSERETDYDLLKSRMEEENLPISDYQWYLDLRKYGSVPHSGFGVGLERLVSWISGVRHVRETIPFPRMIYRLSP